MVVSIFLQVVSKKIVIKVFVLQLCSPARLNQKTAVEVVFMNPVNETLRDCTLTISGSGLVDGEEEYK